MVPITTTKIDFIDINTSKKKINIKNTDFLLLARKTCQMTLANFPSKVPEVMHVRCNSDCIQSWRLYQILFDE